MVPYRPFLTAAGQYQLHRPIGTYDLMPGAGQGRGSAQVIYLASTEELVKMVQAALDQMFEGNVKAPDKKCRGLRAVRLV